MAFMRVDPATITIQDFFPDASDDSDGFWESELPYDPTNPDMPPSGINTDERTQITLTTNGSNTITATAGNALQNQNPTVFQASRPSSVLM